MATIEYRKRTQDSIWYNLLPAMEKNNIKVQREWIKTLIRKVCNKLGITRESIGIMAGARATMFFNGRWSSVKFEDIQDLAKLGTDIVVIEKMDIVEVLSEHASKYGVALLNTSGYFTEYGVDLMNAAEAARGHVVILTDYDDHGLQIATKAPGIVRIGIDEETLRYFGLNRDKLSIPGQKHLKNFGFLDEYDDKVVDKAFVKRRRVEIDAVLAEVGGERLWEFIQHKLVELHRIRDYNRALEMPSPETLYPEPVQNTLTFVHEHVSKSIEAKQQEIMKSLSETEGLIDVKDRGNEIQKVLQKEVDSDPGMKKIVDAFEKLLKDPVIEKLLKDLK
jgi:5S rRNA maturation endonuclease (ribonuclease M5)